MGECSAYTSAQTDSRVQFAAFGLWVGGHLVMNVFQLEGLSQLSRMASP